MSAILRKYATASKVNFPLIALGTVNFTSTASLTTADLKLSLNEGAFATVGTAVVNLGSYGYSYSLTTADLTAARITMVIISTAGTKVCEDTMILIETYGHTNAQHTVDLSITTPTVTEIWAQALAQPSAVPAITSSVLSAMAWMYTLSRNKITQTSTLQTIYQTDGSTSISASTVSDDGTTFTRGKFG